jgi:hypothetical protein
MSATILEQSIKVTATMQLVLNTQRMTQDNNDKIISQCFDSKYLCHCSRDVTVLIHAAAVILGGKRQSDTSRLRAIVLVCCNKET